MSRNTAPWFPHQMQDAEETP